MKLAIALICVLDIINRLEGQIIYENDTLLYEGDSCTFNSTTQGVCKYIYQCPIVQNQLATMRIIPVTCGFNGIPIVCCPRPKPEILDSSNETGEIADIVCKALLFSRLFESPKVVIGGVDAKPGEFSSMVALGWPIINGKDYAWDCGGTLISIDYVLTAAHCTFTSNSRYKTNNPTIVRLGTINLKDVSHFSRDVAIAEIFLHQQYKAPVKYNDIALLRLAEEIPYSDIISYACLMVKDFPKRFYSEFLGGKEIPYIHNAFGWGATETSTSSDILQKITIDVVDNVTCNAAYKSNRRLPKGIIDSQICAGAKGIDTCQGDSGGPLVVLVNDVFYLAGVTSFGVKCNGGQVPGVYTRVTSYIDWIEHIVWKS